MTSAGAAIRQARQHAALTQHQLAARSGVRQSNIAAYERGTRNPSAEMTTRLINAARPRPSVLVDRHRDEIRALARAHRARLVEVFGSVARGTDEPGSDLDLLVTFAADASLLDQAALQGALEDLLGVSVDVVSRGGLRARDRQIRADAVAV